MGLVIIFSQVHNINRDTHTVEERSIANEDLMEYVRLLMKDIIENKNYKHYKPIRETTEINVVVKKYIENEKVDDETKTNIAEKYLEAEVTAQELVKKLGVEIKRGYLVEALMKDEEKYYYRNLLGGLYRENPVKSRNYEAVKSSKKWENVGNSYIIPALLLYRYSYI